MSQNLTIYSFIFIWIVKEKKFQVNHVWNLDE